MLRLVCWNKVSRYLLLFTAVGGVWFFFEEEIEQATRHVGVYIAEGATKRRLNREIEEQHHLHQLYQQLLQRREVVRSKLRLLQARRQNHLEALERNQPRITDDTSVTRVSQSSPAKGPSTTTVLLEQMEAQKTVRQYDATILSLQNAELNLNEHVAAIERRLRARDDELRRDRATFLATKANREALELIEQIHTTDNHVSAGR